MYNPPAPSRATAHAACLLLLSCVVLVSFQCSPASRSGGLDWDRRTFTASLKSGQAYCNFSFPFSNSSNRTVTLTSVRSDCDCLIASLKLPLVLPPGGKGEIAGRFTASLESGRLRKYLTVQTDASSQPQRLTCIFNVPEILRVEPRDLHWTTGNPLPPATIHIRAAAMPTHITNAQCTGGDFSCELEEAAPGKHYRLKVTPRQAAKRAASHLIVRTDSSDPRWRQFAIPLTIE